MEIASEEQMYVILRPGPYICAEWEWGGYPAWLLNKGQMELRTTHNQIYLDTVQKWFNTLLPKIKRFNTPWVEILLPSKSRMNMGVITHKVTYI